MNLTLLNEAESVIVRNFFQNDKTIPFLNPIVNSFFDEEQHIEWLLSAIKGNDANLQLLNRAFKKHYFRIRFIRFISSTIRFAAIDFIRRMRKAKERNPLFLDNDTSEKNNKDEFLYNHSPLLDQYFSGDEFFRDSIEDDALYFAWIDLSPKQKQVILLSYTMSYQDIEIAKFLSISPQAVFNRKRKALVKMRAIYSSKVVNISG